MLLLDANIEKPHFSVTIPHLVKQDIHGCMRNADQGLNHDIVNKFDEVG